MPPFIHYRPINANHMQSFTAHTTTAAIASTAPSTSLSSVPRPYRISHLTCLSGPPQTTQVPSRYLFQSALCTCQWGAGIHVHGIRSWLARLSSPTNVLTCPPPILSPQPIPNSRFFLLFPSTQTTLCHPATTRRRWKLSSSLCRALPNSRLPPPPSIHLPPPIRCNPSTHSRTNSSSRQSHKHTQTPLRSEPSPTTSRPSIHNKALPRHELLCSLFVVRCYFLYRFQRIAAS